MTEPDDATKPLTTWLGQPVAPHAVDGVEAERYYCSKCGREVDNEAGDWFHVDERYNA